MVDGCVSVVTCRRVVGGRFFLLPLITQGRKCKTVVAVVDLLVVVRRDLLGSGAREVGPL